MKRIIALILALTLLASALVSCAREDTNRGDRNKEETREPADTDREKPDDKENPDDEKPDDKEPDDTKPNVEKPGNEEPPKKPAEKPDIDGGEITETVLFDEMDVKITATKLECSRSGVRVTLLLENNTEKNLKFLSATLAYSANSVNGWMVEDGYLNAKVAPGKKSYETVRIDGANLAMLGITDIADISLAVDIEDDDYKTYVKTGPMRLETSLAATYDYSADTYRTAVEGIFPAAYEMELLTIVDTADFDHYGIRVLSQALMRNKDGEYIVLTELENTSRDDVKVYSEGFAVNGLLIQGSRWSSDTILAGKRAVMVSNLTDMIDNNIWELLDINEVGKVDYALGLWDMKNDELMDAETLTFSLLGAAHTVDTSGTELYGGNGIRIIYKGFVEDASKYSDDIHLILLVENTTSGSITVDDEWHTMSINGFMTDCSIYSATFPENTIGVMDVELKEYYLDDVNIFSIEDISELEVTLDIRDARYRKIDTPTIKVER